LNNLLRHSYSFLLYGNIFVSAAAASLMFINLHLLNVDGQNWELSSFVFFSTLLAYNFQRIVRVRSIEISPTSKRLNWIKSNIHFLNVVNIICVFSILGILITLPIKTLWILIPFGLISAWYVLGFKKIPALRTISFLKIFIISTSWSAITYGLPWYISSSENLIELVLSLITITSFVFFQTLPFDIRDRQLDYNLGIRTIAQSIGLKKSKTLTLVGFTSVCFFTIIGIFAEVIPTKMSYYAFACLLAFPVVIKISPGSKDVFYSLVVESILFFPFIFYIIDELILLYTSFSPY